MIRTWVYIGILISFAISQANAKQLALSFDDSPRAAGGYLTGPERAQRLIAALRENQVSQVAFFSVSGRLDEEGMTRLKRYNDAGYIIANHTHSHPDFNKVSLAQYVREIQQAERSLSQFSQYRKWFRFPYLREGDTREKRDGVRRFFKEQGYFNAYITLNNYDWYIESLFQNAIETDPGVDLKAVEGLYVDVLMESINYYDSLATKYLKRSPRHILLLHENDIAALFVGALIKRLRKDGWEIIPIEQAYQDDIAGFHIDQPLRFNPGRVGEVAISHGQKKGLWHSSLEEQYLEQNFNRRVLGIQPEG